MKQILNGYWGGYFDSLITLDQTPIFYNYITLAFVGPNHDSSLTTDFLCSNYKPEQIISWIKELQKKETKYDVCESCSG